jgi:FAD:protein FMN transferase
MTDILPNKLSRRRFISIVAGCAAIATAPASANSASGFKWRGRALGADAEIIMYATNKRRARELAMAAVEEIERLEKQFSLYRDDSAMVHLNATGRLAAPSHDMLSLLDHSNRFSELTGGAFDVSMQPLWALYAEHFRNPDANPNGPDPAIVAQTLDAVDYQAIDIGADAVVLTKPEMALSFNGIAQGYITDSVARLFQAGGVHDVLVNLGEFRALGTNRIADRPWHIGERARSALTTGDPVFELSNRALATSAPSGTMFGPSGQHHHIFDPRTGASATAVQSVTVMAPTAVAADALSTTLAVVAPAQRAVIIAATKDIEAVIIDNDGIVDRLKS